MVAVIHLEGEALQWHQGYVKVQTAEGNTMTWPGYVEAVKARFGDKLFDDALLEIRNLRQDDSLADYQRKFDGLLHRVQLIERVSKRDVVSQFIGELDLLL